MQDAVIVLDNGGGSLKLGYATDGGHPSTYPNASGKVKGDRHTLLADQICTHADLSSVSLRRPADRGYIVNWDLQKLIWERAFLNERIETNRLGLVVTEPLFNLPSLQQQMDQVIFEDFGFQSCYPAVPAKLCLHEWAFKEATLSSNQALTGLVIDCGFSSSQVLPVFDGQIIPHGVQRINLGGKALTNYMKELVSFRSMNMMEETYLMEHIKNQTAFTSQNLAADLARAKAGDHRLNYVLPDGLSSKTGYICHPYEKVQGRVETASGKEVPTLHLNNERFLVPELLFSPSNVGLNQAGLAEAVIQSVQKVHPDLHPLLLSNILCCGGMFKCPGFISRLSAEIRSLAPDNLSVELHSMSDPSLTAWYGGNQQALSSAYSVMAYSKAQYEEEGSRYMRTHK